MSIFRGLSAFPITPSDAGGAVITDDLRRIVAPLDGADVQSVGLLGSTGSYPYLSQETRRDAVLVARDCIKTKPLIVGVGALRTDAAIALTHDATDAGADALLLAPVSYLPLREDEVFELFKAVSAETDLPICIYNNPTTTSFTFSTDLLQRLAALPNVDAVKMPLPADLGAVKTLRAALPADFLIGYSADWGCPDCILAGGEAWFSAIAGYLPDETALLARAAETGNTEEVARINASFAPLWDLFTTWGSLRVIHTAANIEGVTKAVLPLPLMPLPEALHADIRKALSSVRSVSRLSR